MTIVKGQVQTFTVTTDEVGTEPIHLNEGQRASIQVTGVAGSTVNLQHRYRVTPGGPFAVAWSDVAGGTITADTDAAYLAAEEVEVRIFCPTSGFGGGSIELRLGAQGASP